MEESEVNPIDEMIKAKEMMMQGNFGGGLTIEAEPTRRMIPRGYRNAQILKRDGYLSPKNADFARGIDE